MWKKVLAEFVPFVKLSHDIIVWDVGYLEGWKAELA